MIEFSETIDHPSKIRKGVTFRLRRINAMARIASNAKIDDETVEFSAAVDEIFALAKEPSTKETRAEIRRLDRRKNQLLIGTIIPHTIREGFITAIGLVDSKKRPITELDEIFRLADDELLGELYGACRDAAQLSDEDLGNSERPGTSSTPAMPAAKTNDTTAGHASENDSMSPETALDTSPTKLIAA